MVCFKVGSGTAWTKAWLLLDCPCISHPPSEIRLVHGDANAQAALKAKLLEWAEGAGQMFKPVRDRLRRANKARSWRWFCGRPAPPSEPARSAGGVGQ